MKKILVLVLLLYLGKLLTVSPVLAIDYALPYPGMLPDSPVYFLKVLRDKAVVWLISDPVQKSFYQLFLADKRLAAGQMLFARGEKTLGAATVNEAEIYFGAAVDGALGAKSSGKNTKDLFAKLTVAAAKHAEVVGDLMNKVAGHDSRLMQTAHQQSLVSGNRVREVFWQNIFPAK